ncbi:MAG: hypothetical protein PHQ86_09835 [Dehalococcoidales bacterium]|nr:hypothetical protein [Dehalococcoidales bacterium]
MARQLAPNAILVNPNQQDPVKKIKEVTGGLIKLNGNSAVLKQALKVLSRRSRISC